MFMFGLKITLTLVLNIIRYDIVCYIARFTKNIKPRFSKTLDVVKP